MYWLTSSLCTQLCPVQALHGTTWNIGIDRDLSKADILKAATPVWAKDARHRNTYLLEILKDIGMSWYRCLIIIEITV